MFDNNINGINDGKRLFMHIENESFILSIISNELDMIKIIIIKKISIVNIFFIIKLYSLV